MPLPRDTWVVREGTAKSMRGNRGKDTRTELAVRRALWAAGLRGYRSNYRKLPGKPDIAFVGKRVAVFVHGCYWHRCPACSSGKVFKTNSDYWTTKLQENAERDIRNQAALEAMGFRVVTLWECEINRDLGGCVDRVKAAFREKS